jgi:hypothetical protein
MPKSKPKKQTPNRAPRHVLPKLLEASTTAMRSMRALDAEVFGDGSEDVIAMRSAEVMTALVPLVRSAGYISESAQLESAGKDIQKELDSRYGMKPNARGQGPGGLADNPILLKSYVEMAAESMDLENWKDAEPNDEVFEVAREYDAALMAALKELVKKYPPDDDANADDLWAAEAPYLVLMTLRGEGVGIWDGDWSHFYADTDKAEKFLKGKLSKFADGTGSGKLEEAFMSAADESCGDSDDDDDDSDEDDEDDEDDSE